MCVSMFEAEFTGTKIAMHMPDPRIVGKEIHVMLYQNVTHNRYKKNGKSMPNAMLLHFDAAEPMTQANFIATTKFRHVLDNMVDAVKPRGRGGMAGAPKSLSMKAEVFDVGIYTVVLASHAAQIPAALKRVPKKKRPALKDALFAFYAAKLKNCSVALCCFEDSAESEPIMVWWVPRDPSMFRYPALDGHGDIPVVGEPVEVDHWIIASTYDMRGGNRVEYQDTIPADVWPYMLINAIGTYEKGTRPNGDYGVPVAQVRSGIMPYELLRLELPSLN